jgi:hypothetical protein
MAQIQAHGNSFARSHQVLAGPSELGMECDHCLAARLAGWPKLEQFAWLPYIGTAVHAQLAEAFTGPEWLSDHKVTVGHVGGSPIEGTLDLFHMPSRTVIDFKVVGKTTLDAARRGNVSAQYRTQVQLYGAGMNAQSVAILYLPRNSASLHEAVWYEEPADELVAQDALYRADELLGMYWMLEETGRGWGDMWVEGLPRAKGCYDCARYNDRAEADPPRGILANIMEKE